MTSYHGLPHEKWSSLRYGSEPRGGLFDVEEAAKPEEIVTKLRQVEVLTAQGRTVAEAIRSIGVTEVTFLPLAAGLRQSEG